MPIFKYQPVITAGPYGTDHRPQNNNLVNLCELDGWRYVSIPNDSQTIIPDELITWTIVELDSTLRELLKKNSPICQSIDQQVLDKIREKYSLDDELYFARISIGDLRGTYQLEPGENKLLIQYQNDIESIRIWGRQEIANLGL